MWLQTEKCIIRVDQIQGFSFAIPGEIHAFCVGDGTTGWLVTKPASGRDMECIREGIKALIEWTTEGWLPDGWKQGDKRPFDTPIITVGKLNAVGEKSLKAKGK